MAPSSPRPLCMSQVAQPPICAYTHLSQPRWDKNVKTKRGRPSDRFHRTFASLSANVMIAMPNMYLGSAIQQIASALRVLRRLSEPIQWFT
ncbi:hypothetical protein M378DRAFT_164667 [Amanita muscaria Koide BX008]|uniref:Uncharacterized protein n=1 Tax=Amanita muscaria (strain Koide BX008) TaxID=946122 RepID=A0A0C2X2G5_AMAMK|nr:hypothetical protein M378DRAFT_164667 [Amanita muscaria Koide BX008]